MAYNSTKLGRLYVRQQTNYETPFSSSAVISPTAPYGDGTPSDYFAVEAEVFMPPTTREIFERAAVKGGFYEIPPVSGSQHGAEFTISKPLVGLSSSALAADAIARALAAATESVPPSCCKSGHRQWACRLANRHEAS